MSEIKDWIFEDFSLWTYSEGFEFLLYINSSYLISKPDTL